MIGYQRAAEFPTISVGTTTSSCRTSSHQPYFLIPNPPPEGELQLPFDLNYEIDLWGRIRRTVAAAREEAQATDADLETVSLSLHAELAIDYIELRSADAQQRLLDDTVKAYTDALRLTQNRLAGGYAPESDVAQAQTQLDTTRVQDTDIGVMRAQYEHAIAVLIGQPPAAFSLPPAPLDLQPPSIPPGIPSELLQRRPDIAAAERRVAEANEQIGIAQAAYYPSLNLSALSGFEGTSAANLVRLAEPVLGGRHVADAAAVRRRQASCADRRQARAAYDAAVATYRQTTLTAFQQVEDNLAALRILQRRGAAAARGRGRGGQLAADLHQPLCRRRGHLPAGDHRADRRADQPAQRRRIMRRRMEASILLVKALGGGWNVSSLPKLTERGIPRGAIVPSGSDPLSGCTYTDKDSL